MKKIKTKIINLLKLYKRELLNIFKMDTFSGAEYGHKTIDNNYSNISGVDVVTSIRANPEKKST